MPDQVPATQTAAIFDFNGTLVTGEVWQALESWMGGRRVWKRRKSLMIVRKLPVILASKTRPRERGFHGAPVDAGGVGDRARDG